MFPHSNFILAIQSFWIREQNHSASAANMVPIFLLVVENTGRGSQAHSAYRLRVQAREVSNEMALSFVTRDSRANNIGEDGGVSSQFGAVVIPLLPARFRCSRSLPE